LPATLHLALPNACILPGHLSRAPCSHNHDSESPVPGGFHMSAPNMPEAPPPDKPTQVDLWSLFTFFFCLFAVLETKPRASHMLGKGLALELQPSPRSVFLKSIIYDADLSSWW
jgi:hypothetical protein